MLKVYRENGGLFVESKFEMRFPVTVNGVVYSKKEDVTFEEMDVVHALLRKNARVLINMDGEFIKPDLYEFENAMSNKKYSIVDGLPTTKIQEEKVVETKPEINDEIVEDEVEEDTQESKKPQNNQQYQNNNDKKRNKNRHNNEPQVKVEEGDK